LVESCSNQTGLHGRAGHRCALGICAETRHIRADPAWLDASPWLPPGMAPVLHRPAYKSCGTESASDACLHKGPIMKLPLVSLSLVAAAGLSCTALPAAAEDFYRGKTITLALGFSPGGVYDATARLLAKHMGDHIAGKPPIIVQTMMGAGGSTAIVHLYNAALRDGTAIAMAPRNYPTAPYVNPQLHYDARRFNAIGSTTSETLLGVIWHAAPVKSFADTFTQPINAGVSTYFDDIGSTTLLAKSLGAKLNMVTGYPSGYDISLAMEKGEVDSEFGWSWGSVKSRAKNWLAEKKITIILQLAMTKAPDLPDVPFIMDFAKTEQDRQALELLMAPQTFAWPFIAPPDVPADRVAMLRRAFDQTMTDPSFVADAKQLSIDINPMTGEAMQALIEHILSFDQSVVARVQELVRPPS
jgi:tripartite-type tricarboxylate transporter receptor subunit TctC